MQPLNDPRALRAALIGYTEQVIALEAKVNELAPQAAAWSRLADTSGVITISNVAKACGVPPLWFGDFLEEKIYWCFRRRPDGYWPEGKKPPLVAYQNVIDRGWMTHKMISFTRADGSVWSKDQACFTPAGAAKVAMLLEQRSAKEAA